MAARTCIVSLSSARKAESIKIESFHDVLCAWCYAFSPRLRRLVWEHLDTEIVHRAFALAPDPVAIARMFGDKGEGKRQILSHWRAANMNDDEHRIRADLMATRDFDYPHSMPGLLGCKAAEFQRGQAGHWDYFDRVQQAHVTECVDIADDDVLERCAQDVGLDVARFRRDVGSRVACEGVEADMEIAARYGVTSTPSIVVNEGHLLSGAVSYEHLIDFLKPLSI